jgi:predicted RNase H-like nuclease (RuvC/YqgF family)
MFEQIEQLEGRVETLMSLLEESGQRIEDLQRENRRLQHELETKADVEEQNVQYRRQIELLENTLEENGKKEAQIRERLKGMLTRIDSLETELHRGAQG